MDSSPIDSDHSTRVFYHPDPFLPSPAVLCSYMEILKLHGYIANVEVVTQHGEPLIRIQRAATILSSLH